VRTLAGDVFSYSTIWQHRNLVLVTISESASDTDYVASLFARREDFEQLESVCVITRDRVSGVATPGALVADRWGEIAYVAAAPHVTELPTASELIEWLDYVERRCPECEGEAR
jgi:hypothetical protein